MSEGTALQYLCVKKGVVVHFLTNFAHVLGPDTLEQINSIYVLHRLALIDVQLVVLKILLDSAF